MKKFITLLLMITIQVTFMQKVMASVPVFESDTQAVKHCNMLMMNTVDCSNMLINMQDCNDNCDLMNVVSVTHFIESTVILSFAHSPFNYPVLNLSPLHAHPKSLYRPPLLS
ncbi:hypothetical protein [Psychromonas sp. SR45-3]|uniref:hypothetical protein n=1 Tax=Psychromonas sp. SR45-3 TaxID=2760930 RepID=UPI0015F9C4FE|nr:hypothetical protein [Psychromonas sp. SR45-3]MBB1274637.1 hypothetical protein [Psychromonas sp. SR45-3]